MHEPSTSPDVARRRPTLGYLKPLDGVRAVAVIAVVLYHAGITRLHGGFLGVDVFFVLSGFLITSLLVTELSKRSTLGFARFYARRARRLLPALVVLIGIVVLLAYVVTPHGSYPSLPGQVIGTMLYVGNWTLVSNHASYFSMGLPPSPLQHTWSLAIEEQFYLVWPVLLFGLWKLTQRFRTLAVVCVVGSLACAAVTYWLLSHGTGINALYFGTQTHATTMLLGAALAFLTLRRTPAPDGDSFVVAPPRRQLAWNTLGVVAWAAVIAMFFIANGTSASLYRGGYVVVGVVVATAIGATILVPNGWSARVLATAPLVFIGRISYGIYLYHFPLFLWVDHGRTGLSGFWLLVVRLGVTVGVATLSYFIVELPIRERRLLKGRSGMIASITAFVGVAVLAFSITSAAAFVPFADKDARWNLVRTAPAGTTVKVLLVGDSMAQTLGNGLNNPLAKTSHVFVSVLGVPTCSLVSTPIRLKGFLLDPRKRCAWSSTHGLPYKWERRLRKVHPALSMVLFRLDIADHRLFGQWTSIGNPTYDCVLRAHLIKAASVLSSTGRPVAFLTIPYFSTGEQPNGTIWREDAPSRVNAYNRMLRSVAASFPGVIHVVNLNALVSPDGKFARTIGPTVVRWVDGVHFTYGGDAYVLPRLLPSIQSLSRLTPTATSLRRLHQAAAVRVAPTCRPQ